MYKVTRVCVWAFWNARSQNYMVMAGVAGLYKVAYGKP